MDGAAPTPSTKRRRNVWSARNHAGRLNVSDIKTSFFANGDDDDDDENDDDVDIGGDDDDDDDP